ncbi:MAG TPA: dihydrolipoamide acetyltransferase family protein [Anaeromyxobacteraceae bacterium]|nr:dihydrolipoamide acetyltransferase family protein [Anaeromyxobacteraceae bacterium]
MAYQLELPDIGEGVVEAEVQKWFVAPGDAVEEDQPLVEVMTDKATVVIPSPRRGRIVRLFWKEGEIAKVHAPLVEIELDGAAAVRSASAPAAGEAGGARSAPARDAAPAGETAGGPLGAPVRALAAPAVRALAREMGVDLQAVRGTGPGGRVTRDDLAAFRKGGNGAVAPQTPAAPAAARPSDPPVEERIPLRGVRRKIAENMARSKRTAAHFTFVEQADVTELIVVKERMAAAAREEGVKVTFLPFVLKAAVAALRRFPRLAASLDEERQEIVVKRRYDLGIAASTEQGLVVPVVRGVDRLSLLDLAREVERLAQDAKAGRLRPEDVGGSTFTVTSLGALGGLFATPVLNHPEVGILGIHRIRPTPVARDGQVVVRDVMHVSLTSDHRVVDGHEAAAFTYEVIRALEDPSLLFLRMA